MPRKKKKTKALNLKIDSNLYDQLEKYADMMGQTKTVAVERLLQEGLQKYNLYLNKTDEVNHCIKTVKIPEIGEQNDS